jgi:hypothetical protein
MLIKYKNHLCGLYQIRISNTYIKPSCTNSVMRLLIVLLITSAFIFSNMLIATATVSASISDDYCFDQDLEDSLCYETKKACEKERKNDLMAESKCYKAID